MNRLLRLISFEKKSSAAVVIGALRVNTQVIDFNFQEHCVSSARFHFCSLDVSRVRMPQTGLSLYTTHRL